jgi:hypothetical protein
VQLQLTSPVQLIAAAPTTPEKLDQKASPMIFKTFLKDLKGDDLVV